ncbi:MAG: hypothetical protein LBS49_12165 [Candidatus Accumulibacter sp.]|nr:hypothetical protein [Accumulibacter sp.]
MKVYELVVVPSRASVEPFTRIVYYECRVILHKPIMKASLRTVSGRAGYPPRF